MVDNGHHIDVLDKRFDMTVERTNSRLVVRGHRELQLLRGIEIPVLNFSLIGSGLIVQSSDWDLSAQLQSTELGSNQDRRLNLYSFGIDGSFSHRIECALIRFSGSAQSRIAERRPGRVSVQDRHIHFWESLLVNPGNTPVRIDYIFDHNGGRLAAWTNDTFVDKNSEDDETNVPVIPNSVPRWVTGYHLVFVDDEYTGKGFYPYWKATAKYHFYRPFPISQMLERVDCSTVYEALCGRSLSFDRQGNSMVSGRRIDSGITSFADDEGNFRRHEIASHASTGAIWRVGEYRYEPTGKREWIMHGIRYSAGEWESAVVRLQSPQHLFAQVFAPVHQKSAGRSKRARGLKTTGATEFQQLGFAIETDPTAVDVRQVLAEDSQLAVVTLRNCIDSTKREAICVLRNREGSLEFWKGIRQDEFLSRAVDECGESVWPAGSFTAKHCAFRDGVLGTVISSESGPNRILLTELRDWAMNPIELKVPEADLSLSLRLLGSE